MPWSASEAKGHTKKANTPAKQKKWAKIANAALKTYSGTEGAEGKAIATANKAMGDRFWDTDLDLFLTAKWQYYQDRRSKRAQRYDPQGRESGSEEYDIDDTAPAQLPPKKKKRVLTPVGGVGGADTAIAIPLDDTAPAQSKKTWGIRAHRSGKANPEEGVAGQDQPDHSEWLKGEDGKPLLYENEKDAMDSAERHNGMMENMKKMTFHHAKYEPMSDSEVNCPTCDGSGLDPNSDDDCPTCHGSGVVENDETDPDDILLNMETHHEGLGGPWGSEYWEEAAADADSEEVLHNARRRARAQMQKQGKEYAGTPVEADDGDYRAPYSDAIYDREFSGKQRKEAAESGAAMKGGGFPIKNKEDLANARQALGRAKNRKATIAHIKKRAAALGVKLPEGWPNDSDPFVEDESLVSVPSIFTNHQTMFDTVVLDAGAEVHELENGYIAAMPRIARTGIQIYRGSECGRPDLDRVRVFRPADQVFDGKAVHSYTHLPVTLDHPPEAVNSANWRRYAIGETGDEVLRDGNAVRVPMMLRDAEAIQAFRDGTNQLSVGYDCDLDWSDGVTEQGEKYDAIQRGIRANHLAVVAAARGGSSLKIGDDHTVQEGDTAMNLKTIVVDGLEIQVLDQAAPVIQRTIQGLEAKLRDAFKKIKEKEEEDDEDEEENNKKDAAIKAKDAKIKEQSEALASKDAEIVTVKKQLTDAQEQLTPTALDARVRGRMATIMKAKTLMGDAFKVDGQTVEQLRRAVVESRLGDLAKGWNDGQIEASFNTLQASSAERFGSKDNRTAIDDAVAAFGRPGQGYMSVADAKAKAYTDYDADISQAYRNPNGAPQH